MMDRRLTVISKVLDGGDGCINGGSEERSIESGEASPRFDNPSRPGDEVGDAGGDIVAEGIVISMMALSLVKYDNVWRWSRRASREFERFSTFCIWTPREAHDRQLCGAAAAFRRGYSVLRAL